MPSGAENIMVQVRRDLLAIDGNSPWSNKIHVVERDLCDENAIQSFPAISMVEEDEVTERAASSQNLFFELALMLLVYARTTPGVPTSTLLNSLAADVKLAMIGSQHWTHSGTCHRTIYRGKDPMAVKGEAIAGVVMRFAFHYSHRWDTP